MKVYLDDIRPEPEGWVRTYTAKETIELLKTGQVTELSLDHDLDLIHYSEIDNSLKEETGYDVLLWIEEQLYLIGDDYFIPEKIHLHTANPSGRFRMSKCLESIRKKQQEIKYENT